MVRFVGLNYFGGDAAGELGGVAIGQRDRDLVACRFLRVQRDVDRTLRQAFARLFDVLRADQVID